MGSLHGKMSGMTACVLMVALFSAGGAMAAATNLKLGHVGAPESPQQTIATLFSEKVANYSDKSIDIKTFNSSALGNERQLQEGVRSGTVDLTIAGTFSHFVPWAGVLETPLLYRDLKHFVDFYSGPDSEDFLKVFSADAKVVPLFIVPHGGFRYITVKDNDVRTPDDLKGVKIRNPNVPAFNVMAQVVEAIPVPIDFSELYVALQRGVVQGQHNPVGNIVGARLYEVQDSLSMVPWGISPHIVSMSERAWKRLSPEQQAAVRKAAAETAKEYPAIAVQAENRQLDQIRSQIKIIPPEDLDMEAFGRVFREKGVPALKKEYGDAGGQWLDKIIAFQ